MTKYDKILTKSDRNDKIHVGNFQERNFSKLKNTTPRITQDWGGVWGGIGVLLIALLTANALTQPPTQPPYSRGLLKASEECLLINYCMII